MQFEVEGRSIKGHAEVNSTDLSKIAINSANEPHPMEISFCHIVNTTSV